MNAMLAASLLTTCLTATAIAQTTGPGLSWAGSTSIGAFHQTCTNLPVDAAQNEVVTVRVWGDPNAPFVLGVAFSLAPCVPLPGIGNGLMLGAPVFVLATGTLTETTPCLSCPPGLESLVFTVPTFLPVGTALSLQALTLGNNSPSLTVAITATVR